ncbi:hypothetical protein LCGC14_2478180 [marine sediment metagenome]|uniref:Uncharacterized protein n=1 Tax=marine sediment metagenome TaxID=412755 RepID=A0A0F9DKE4_9ZZZZ
MSADNWAWCPQCMKHAEATQQKDIVDVEAVYGTIPSEEYAKRREVAYKDIELSTSMREDWEVGMNLIGEFSVTFSASCSDCGFRFMFEGKRQADLE